MICKLPELMSRDGVNQKTLAYKTGLSPTTVGKLYRGHFDRIDNNTVMSLVEFFGLKSISELIDIEWDEDRSEA